MSKSSSERLKHDVLNRVSKPRPATSTNGKPAKKSNRFTPINALVDHRLAELSGVEVKVYLTIWRWINPQTKVASLSHQQIAETCGVERRSVIRSIKTLIEKDLVKRTFKGSASKKESSSYIVLTPN